ncbi:pyridoxamine 5'-phosphate oxidase family protein [soil metagenome]
MSTSWIRLGAEAPELASSITSRFDANLHHILGTIRSDGSPRLSGSEIEITPDRIRLGMMPDSHKLADVRRDPRVEIHSAPLDPKLADGDAKLLGLLIDDNAPDQPGSGFVLDIAGASVVRVAGDELEFTTWSPTAGLHTLRRQ